MNHTVIAQLCQQQPNNPQSVESLAVHTSIAPETLHHLFTTDSLTITALEGPWWDGKTGTQPTVKPMADNAGTWG
jgi:hypothetical protein